MEPPKNPRKMQLWGFLLMVAAVLILILGALAKNSVLTAVGMAVIFPGGLLYIYGRWEPGRKRPDQPR